LCLPLLPVLLSRQIQHSLSMAEVTAVVVAVSTAAVVVAVFMVVAVVADSTATVTENIVAAVPPAAHDLLVAGVPAKVADQKLAGISVPPKIVRRIFVPQSTMVSGIPSATPVIPCVPSKDAPEG
jgi:hypothetical protein